MALYRSDFDDLYWWLVDGYGLAFLPWNRIFSASSWSNDRLVITSRPSVEREGVALIDLLDSGAPGLVQDMDHVELGLAGSHFIALRNVDYVSTQLPEPLAVDLHQLDHFGFTTNGTLRSITSGVGNHLVTFETAKRDSSVFLGDGFDRVVLADDPDIVAYETFWTVRREFDNSVIAYALSTGNVVELEGGETAMYATNSFRNYGEIERLSYMDFRDDAQKDLYLGKGDVGEAFNRSGFENIDLNKDDLSDPIDTFLHASFGSINFSSRNVFVGAAVVEEWNGTEETAERQSEAYRFSTTSIAAADHNHDLYVYQQGAALDGHLRLYVRDETSRTYNRFNEVFLGSSGADNDINTGSTTDRNGTGQLISHTAMYGFGGNDTLTAGGGDDYLFGGESSYSIRVAHSDFSGNVVTGGNGADHFGVGNVTVLEDGDLIMSTYFTDRLGGAAVTGEAATLSSNAANESDDLATRVATDRIQDWTFDVDFLRVLPNGTAIIEGLGTANGSGTGGYVKDLLGGDAELINLSGAKVVNEGKIVARGLDGNDTLIGSSGQDWLYGNADSNIILTGGTGLAVGTSPNQLEASAGDRVFYDTRTGKQYVEGFQSGTDKFYVAKNVIDAFTGGASRNVSTVDATSGDLKYYYTPGEAYDQNITFIHKPIYKGILSARFGSGPYSNEQYYTTDFFADTATSAAGSAMNSIGSALLSVPFVGPALAVPFYALGFTFKAAQSFQMTGIHSAFLRTRSAHFRRTLPVW